MAKKGSRRVAGSGVSYPLDEEPRGPVEPVLPLQVTIVLRPRNRRAHLAGPPMHPAERHILSVAAFDDWYDPGEDRVRVVQEFADEHGLKVLEVSRARHDVVLAATADQFSRAFRVTLKYFGADGAQYYAYDERLHLPAGLGAVTESVLGLENIPTHRPRAVAARRNTHTDIPALERQYCFPAVDARGRRIALLEFGGGFFAEDITEYANRIGIAEPRVTPVSVVGATGQPVVNAPLDRGIAAAIAREWKASVPFATLIKKHGHDLSAFIASLEVTMDIQLALALGAGAAVDVYFAPTGVDGWRRALYAMIGLPVGGASGTHPPVPTVLSISWGESESVFGPEQLRMIDRALVAVKRAGLAVCCSSGDWGSVNSAPKPGVSEHPNVNFPASSPSVLACGGTRLLTGRPSADSRPEVAWNERALGVSMATGGGVSGFFDRPKFQDDITLRPAKGTWRAPGRGSAAGRALPDIAANAALSSGPPITFAGEELVGYGTSAAAPICASLLARVAASVDHSVAGVEGWLYTADAKTCCRPVVKGDNDVTDGAVAFYEAGPGWNACTGLGALDGEKVVTTLIQTRRADRMRK